VLGGEVIEGQEDVSVLREVVACGVVLGNLFFQEVVEGLGRHLPGLGEPDLVKVAFRLRPESPGHLVEHIGRFVNPAPLRLGRRADLSESGPEAKGSVTDGELWRLRESPLLEVEQEFLPALLAHTNAFDDSDQLLLAVGRCSHEDEKALLLVTLVLHPHVDINAVGPDVHVLLVREVPTTPLLVLPAPLVLEADDDIWNEALDISADQRPQSLVEVPRRDAREVEPWDQVLDGPTLPQGGWQGRGGEDNPLIGPVGVLCKEGPHFAFESSLKHLPGSLANIGVQCAPALVGDRLAR